MAEQKDMGAKEERVSARLRTQYLSMIYSSGIIPLLAHQEENEIKAAAAARSAGRRQHKRP